MLTSTIYIVSMFNKMQMIFLSTIVKQLHDVHNSQKVQKSKK